MEGKRRIVEKKVRIFRQADEDRTIGELLEIGMDAWETV